MKTLNTDTIYNVFDELQYVLKSLNMLDQSTLKNLPEEIEKIKNAIKSIRKDLKKEITNLK